eukprot:COSAG06_NODE_17622_length_930_cov_1.022864_1_plen_73_part_10
MERAKLSTASDLQESFWQNPKMPPMKRRRNPVPPDSSSEDEGVAPATLQRAGSGPPVRRQRKRVMLVDSDSEV